MNEPIKPHAAGGLCGIYYKCRCGFEYEEGRGEYGCPDCEGSKGPAKLI